MSPVGRRFGSIPAVEVGMVFNSRHALSAAGVHPPTMAGISGTPHEGADSIVLSGGYEDDVDLGDTIVYTGHGGNDPDTGKQVGHQTLTRQNLALAKSCIEGLPVRVTRGARLDSPYRPDSGYRYDGLYRVESYWSETGRAGFLIWRFRLVRDGAIPPLPAAAPTQRESLPPVPRLAVTTQRLIRNTRVVQRVKEMHDHHCQVCGIRLETTAGPYSEGAHIRPLGRPHDGPDREDNILCLCPNHHALFDLGGLVVGDDFVLIDVRSDTPMDPLRRVPGHVIDVANLAYHRGLFLHRS